MHLQTKCGISCKCVKVERGERDKVLKVYAGLLEI
jgi:hypothetical protein